MLPYQCISAIIARNVKFSGFDYEKKSTKSAIDKLKSGAASKLLFFDLPDGFKENIIFNEETKCMDFSMVISKPCIIGYVAEPFDAFPLLNSPESSSALRGIQCCMADELLDHNRMGEVDLESQQIRSMESSQADPWPPN